MIERIESVVGPTENFWNALKIYYEHPNSINKQILLSQHVFFGRLLSDLGNENRILEIYKIICDNKNFDNDILQNINDLKLFSTEDLAAFPAIRGVSLLIRKLIPKQVIHNSVYYEFLFLDRENTSVTILTKHIRKENKCSDEKDPLLFLKFNHIKIQFDSIKLKLQYEETLGEKGINWLIVKFIPKFMNLMKANNINNENNQKNKFSDNFCFSNKIDIVEYYKVYKQLKSKYAESLIKNWTENTDPKKYVFEDIAIASYLLLLWNSKNISKNYFRKQKFIDLGCGNGLLVHILNSEGHLGIGLDMRKRKIWDVFDSKTILKEEIIVPTEAKYPEVDWLIGNHSDELTPWIPIMALQNSPICQYFVLPCCPYQLNGQKFQRQNSGFSSYKDFIFYVKRISELCNFETFVDRLRIPSTKKICLIGIKNHNLIPEDLKLIENKVLSFIKLNCQSQTEQDSEKFVVKLRDPVEKVRNCTKLKQNIIDEVLKKVMAALLEHEYLVKLTRNNEIVFWNQGERTAISKLAESVGEDLLKNLKNECKGLQTLLKNHHYLFEVKGGMVQFRSPENLERLSHLHLCKAHKSKWKWKKCWFHENHPNGCPLNDNKCSFQHL